jgi:hypothetical protein
MLLLPQTPPMETETIPAQYSLPLDLPSPADLAPLHVIRTETVLSRMPIHNLSKKGYVEIGITRRNELGQVDLKWEVSYSSKYGPPRQLAYKLDTLVVNRRIDEQRRPVPKVLKLGSLSQICSALDLPSSGKNTNNLKKAILQNAGSLVTAKLSYHTTAGVEKRLEAVFTRYSVVFTGERLPNGQQADGVYLIFNEPYWEVLNNAPVRPLNYDYLKQLPPTPQRFYEIVSYRMFVALKYEHPFAKLSYSDFCTYSAQQRYFDYDQVKKQMYKVHRPHLLSQYIVRVIYEPALDGEGRPDWMMFYEPGPKARAEFAAFESRPQLETAPEAVPENVIESEQEDGSAAARAMLMKELAKRRVTARQAAKLMPTGPMELQRMLDQLEWGDALIRQASPNAFYNPPGFYVYLIRENIAPPPSFETNRMREARRRAQQDKEVEFQSRLAQELAYEEYRQREVDRSLAKSKYEAEYRNLLKVKRSELMKQYRSLSFCSKAALDELVESAARAQIARDLPLLSFDDFCRQPAARIE